ncbi:hypothetical protein KUF71_008308 [Frankliniella fusca]|uniref:Uncharacterized protein n=1 Tax=Frankliniella fusca TaxID=407009 RepID=A0AAE1LHR5_9NEOP|nr:hypothetical protein KUF71_008308 [Frankliniella fusca]
MSVPDALSRLPAPSSINFLSPLFKAPVTFDRISEASLADPSLEKIYDFTYFGWPHSNPFPTHSELSVRLRIRDQLSISKKCLLYGSRAVIPPSLQSECLAILNMGNPDSYSKWIHIQPMLTTVASASNQLISGVFNLG